MRVTGVAATSDGGLVAVGLFRGVVDFGGGARDSGGLDHVFAVKLGSDGSYRWDRTWAGREPLPEVAAAPDGGVVVTGAFAGPVDFGGGRREGPFGVFVVRLGADGGYRWDRTWGDGTGPGGYLALDVARDGSVVVAGSYWGTFDFGGGPRTSEGRMNGYVVKLGSDGGYQWDRTWASSGGLWPRAVHVGTDGTIVVTGAFRDAADLGGGERVAARPGSDAFVVKLGSDGSYHWDRVWVGPGASFVGGVVPAPGGGILLAGWYAGSLDLGGGRRTSSGWVDGFLVELDSGGDFRWDRTWGGTDTAVDSVYAEALAARESVVVAGTFRGSVDFGGGRRSVPSGSGAFVVGVGADGNYRWDRAWVASDGGVSVASEAVALSADGSVSIVGWFEGSVDFGGGPRGGEGGRGGFVVLLGCS